MPPTIHNFERSAGVLVLAPPTSLQNFCSALGNFSWKALSHRRKVGIAVETVGASGSTASRALAVFTSQANGARDEV
jgi:hypothetical protein